MAVVDSPNDLRDFWLESYVLKIAPASFFKWNFLVLHLFENFDFNEVSPVVEHTRFAVNFIRTFNEAGPIACARLHLRVKSRQRDDWRLKIYDLHRVHHIKVFFLEEEASYFNVFRWNVELRPVWQQKYHFSWCWEYYTCKSSFDAEFEFKVPR